MERSSDPPQAPSGLRASGRSAGGAPVEARRLLAETELTVEAIGARVGYDDPSYFIKRFRRAHAVTPLQWRRGA